MWEAYYVACVHRVTGLNEDAILWELPMSRGYAYQHAHLTREGVDMKWSGEDAQPDATMQRALDMIRNKPWRR